MTSARAPWAWMRAFIPCRSLQATSGSKKWSSIRSREREVVVVADVRGVGAGLLPERGQVGAEVVAAALLEFREQTLRPVRAVHLEAVAEDRPEAGRRPASRRVHHPVACAREEQLQGLGAEVVEDGAFHRRPSAASPAARGLVHEEHTRASGPPARPKPPGATLLARVVGAARLVGQHDSARRASRRPVVPHRRRHDAHDPVVARSGAG